MIVEFSVQNFRSIKELQTLSFVCSGLKSPEAFASIDSDNVVYENSTKLLKTIGVYGSNASGKSNLVKALVYFLQAIKNEPSSSSILGNLCDPFKYQENADTSSSFFQIVVIHEGKKYRYGFTIRKNIETPGDKVFYSSEVIEKEWLYVTREKNMGKYFERSGMEVSFGISEDIGSVPSIPYAHTLYLTHDAAFIANGACFKLRSYLKGWTLSNVIKEHEVFRWNTLQLLSMPHGKETLLSMLREFNLPYDDMELEKDETKDNPVLIHEKIALKKSFLTAENKVVDVALNLAKTESAGTQKLFDLAGFLCRVFVLGTPSFTIIDEIDSNFHPALLIKIIKLFNNSKINTNKSQLLFTSHDTNLMSPDIMRRDQFYFTEKNTDQSTRLYSLADLKGIRNDADFARQYLMGFYGALPVFETYCSPKTAAE